MPFRHIVGHPHLLRLLSGAAARGSVPPSLIFAGPDGVGKRMTAIALGQVLNCESPIEKGRSASSSRKRRASTDTPGRDLELDACGVCPACRRIARGVHADVIEVSPGETGSIKVDQIREIVERSAYRPFEGKRRVVLVNEADSLIDEAQNALLKTLEEPPSASVFILVTSRPDALLPTVRSRCPLLRFGPLSAAEISTALVEQHRWSSPDAATAAAWADGSLGRALQSRGRELTEAREIGRRLLNRAAAASDPRRLLDAATEIRSKHGKSRDADRHEVGQRLRVLSSLLRDLGVLSTRADRRWLVNADMATELQGLTASYDSGRATRAFSAVDQALAALERNASPKIVTDWLVFQL